MMFVTVGSTPKGFSFHRLIKEVDNLSPRLPYKVFMQIGSSTYEPKNCDYTRFIPYTEMQGLLDKSELIVSHCSAGILLQIAKLNKPAVFVPRLKSYNEHIDDHQTELGEYIKTRKWPIIVSSVGNISESIHNAMIKKENTSTLPASTLAGNLKSYLETLLVS